MREIITNIKAPDLVAKRREQILKASMFLFRKQGYHGTTMREICEKSKVNRGSFYDYFGSKEDILVYLYKQMMYPEENLDKTFRKVHISGRDDLEPYIRSIMNASWNKYGQRIQLLYRETIALDQNTLKEVMRIESDYVKWVAENLRKGLGLPEIGKELEIIANAIVYMGAFMPLRGWNMDRLEQKEILDLSVAMFMKQLADLKSSGAGEATGQKT